MHRQRADSRLFQATAELPDLYGRHRLATPRGRVVDENLDRGGADPDGPICGLEQASSELEVGPDRPAAEGGAQLQRIPEAFRAAPLWPAS